MNARPAGCPHAPAALLGEEDRPRAQVPSDTPLRVAYADPALDAVVYAQYGVQRSDTADGQAVVAELLDAVGEGQDGPALVDLTVAAEGGRETLIVLAYWLGTDAYRRWLARFGPWWDGLTPSALGGAGVWREVMATPPERFQYTGGAPAAGIARILATEPTDTNGYWGGYRDRLQVGGTESLESPFGQTLPPPRTRDGRGRRVRVHAPHNLCFVREGQDWSRCGEHERRIWNEKLAPVLAGWAEYLAGSPEESGCASALLARDRDPQSREPLESLTVPAYFLSLGHLERAARTHVTHMAVMREYNQLLHELQTAGVESGLHLWSETHIVPRGHLIAEYVNCRPETGLMPYFALEDVA